MFSLFSEYFYASALWGRRHYTMLLSDVCLFHCLTRAVASLEEAGAQHLAGWHGGGWVGVRKCLPLAAG